MVFAMVIDEIDNHYELQMTLSTSIICKHNDTVKLLVVIMLSLDNKDDEKQMNQKQWSVRWVG